MKEWFKAAGIRAIKTMAQTAIASIGAAAVISDVDWPVVLSATLLAGILSLLTSIAGLPELKSAESDGEIIFGADGMSKVVISGDCKDATQITLDVLESVPDESGDDEDE